MGSSRSSKPCIWKQICCCLVQILVLLWLLCWLWSPGVANWYPMAWPWGWVTTGAKFDLVGHFYTPTFSSLELISFRCQIHQRRRAQYFGTERNDHSLHEWIACGKLKILQKTLKGPWKEEWRKRETKRSNEIHVLLWELGWQENGRASYHTSGMWVCVTEYAAASIATRTFMQRTQQFNPIFYPMILPAM